MNITYAYTRRSISAFIGRIFWHILRIYRLNSQNKKITSLGILFDIYFFIKYENNVQAITVS